MCGACHTLIFNFGVELVIFALLLGFGAAVKAFVYLIWGEASESEDAGIVGRTTPTKENMMSRAA